MGLIYAPATVAGPKGKTSLKFLVDTGASYTVLPQEAWTRLGLKSTRVMTFTLADGSELRRRISECRIQLKGLRATTPVVLGEGDDSALLGTITLELMGLMLDPFSRSIEPMRMMLAAHQVAAAYPQTTRG